MIGKLIMISGELFLVDSLAFYPPTNQDKPLWRLEMSKFTTETLSVKMNVGEILSQFWNQVVVIRSHQMIEEYEDYDGNSRGGYSDENVETLNIPQLIEGCRFNKFKNWDLEGRKRIFSQFGHDYDQTPKDQIRTVWDKITNQPDFLVKVIGWEGEFMSIKDLADSYCGQHESDLEWVLTEEEAEKLKAREQAKKMDNKVRDFCSAKGVEFLSPNFFDALRAAIKQAKRRIDDWNNPESKAERYAANPRVYFEDNDFMMGRFQNESQPLYEILEYTKANFPCSWNTYKKQRKSKK